MPKTELPLSKKYRSIKPNTEPPKKVYKTVKKEEEFEKKEINSDEVLAADMFENGLYNLLFLYFALRLFLFYDRFIVVLSINKFYYFFIPLSVIAYDNDDYFDEEETDPTEISLGQMLESHATSEDEFCNNSYEYE